MTEIARVVTTHETVVDSTLNMTKFRELSPNSVKFISNSHTSELNDTLVLTSTLPKATTGSPGVTRTSFNMQKQVKLYAGTEAERIVPIVVKLECSVPVGIDDQDLDELFHRMGIVLGMGNLANQSLFLNGIIPGI